MGALFDPVFIENFREMEKRSGSAIVSKLIQLYKKNLEDLFTQVPEFFRQSQWEDLQRAFHSMKSTSGNLGLLQMQGLCSELEDCCKRRQSLSTSEFEKRIFSGLGDLQKAALLAIEVLSPYDGSREAG